MAYASVDDYLATQSHPALLARVRDTIRKSVPQAEESISYNIPTYKLNGRVMIYFAGWKKHYSVYPASPEMLAAFEKELASYQVSKGTIQFPLDEPVPVKLIARLARFRAREASKKQA